MSFTVVLSAIDISADYVLDAKKGLYINAVDSVSIDFKVNEVVGIAGESGCGKSTLVKILYGAIFPPLIIRKGNVYLIMENVKTDIIKMSREEIRKKIWWRYISYIPQNSMNVLNPVKKIKDQFIEVFKYHDEKIDKKEIIRKIEEYFKDLGLPVEALNAYPHQLSGGMRQRVVIALSLLFNPRIVIADEPTTAVDVVTQLGILNLLKNWQRNSKATLIIVSHDMSVHAYMDDRVAVMYAGNMVEIGSKYDIFENPLHPYTKMLIASLIRKGEKKLRTGIAGEPPNLLNPPPSCRFHPRCPFAMDICRKDPPPMVESSDRRIVRCWLYAKI
uniref:ABC transporter ATP-binding protein n=1 Tax=Ignisphaera aggregans TaxID=334771 RepID=A0A7C5YSH8_9CREN